MFFFYVSSVIFKENHVLIEEENPSEKIVILEGELDSIDRDGINEECWKPNVVVDGGELRQKYSPKEEARRFTSL